MTTEFFGSFQQVGKFQLCVRFDQDNGWYWDIYVGTEMVESSRWIPTEGSDETYYTTSDESFECGESMCKYMEVHGHPLEPMKG